MLPRTVIAFLLAFSSLFEPLWAQTPGVTKEEIVLATVQPLSGPMAPLGRQIAMGLQLRMDEANDAGGVNGRKLRLHVEDHGFTPQKSVAAIEKLATTGPGIFAVIAHFGSSNNVAALPGQLDRGIVNFFPVSAAREMYEPYHQLKFANAATYFDQVRIAAPRLMQQLNLKSACVLYQDDGLGQEVLKGAEAGLKVVRRAIVEQASYKPGAKDLVDQVARLKAAGCDLVVLGTVTRETVMAMTEATRVGLKAAFVGPNTVYGEQVPKLGGQAVEGLFSAMTWQVPYLDDAEQPVRDWANRYRKKFGDDPGVLSVIGYQAMDAFIKAANKAGPNFTTATFVKGVEVTTFRRDMFGGAELNFGPNQRLGNRFSRLSQLRGGRWRVVSDYVAFSGLRGVLDKDGRWQMESEFFRGE